MNVDELARKILNVRKPGKLLFVERVPLQIYDGLVKAMEEQVKHEGPLFSVDFSELVRRTSLDPLDKEWFFPGILERPVLYRNLIASNAYLFSEDGKYSPEQIWSAYVTVYSAREETWVNDNSQLDGMFIAHPEHLLNFRAMRFQKFDPETTEEKPTDIPFPTDLRYMNLGINFAYFRGDKLYSSKFSSSDWFAHKMQGSEKECR